MNKTIDFDLVADLYDSYVQTDFDINFFKNFCKGYNNILELMCGTGRVSLPLIENGHKLTCVDYSENMLKILHSKLNDSANTKIIYQDVCNLDLKEQFDLVIIPFNSFAEIIDKAKRKQSIDSVYRHLLPDGRFLCTLYNPEYRIKTADGSLKVLGKFPYADAGTLLVTYYNNYSEKDSVISGTQFYEIYDDKNRLKEKRFLDICFSIITKDEIQSMAFDAGFLLDTIYGDYLGNPYGDKSMFMNFVFKKQENRF